MAIIHIHLLEGRSQEVKTAFISEVTEAASRALQSSPDKVLVMLHEISKNHTNVGGKPGRGAGHD
jgi:4-oxalocrotonate tautomerase